MIDLEQAARIYRETQINLCQGLAEVDGGTFHPDIWTRDGGGGGDSRVLEGDGSLEKSAVLFSDVWGETPERLSESVAADSRSFRATGISTIVHPRNPHAPTVHANLRCFRLDNGEGWFGGGVDLTPFYLYEEDARDFHGALRAVCGRHPVADYAGWKKACDDYFFLPHRGEARGIGGIFFDHVDAPGMLEFQRDLGATLLEVYLTILGRRIDISYGPDEEAWHLIRRGRYAEFNLVWDRGTRFGLETAGRTESILSSLPPRVRWDYQNQPGPGTVEARLVDLLRADPRDW
ncbi:MAG: oxygen-dependent coproporphyrinogen oxidase [Acidimicrobiia bacterium]|nr:oxygen-dependent coproporphyrinogen oxidase [Acidimicrobiia bacterium]